MVGARAAVRDVEVEGGKMSRAFLSWWWVELVENEFLEGWRLLIERRSFHGGK